MCVALVLALSLEGSSALPQALSVLPKTIVSVQAKGEGLESVLQNIGKQAHIRLEAVQHLADRRVVLFAKGRSLSEVMEQLESLWTLPGYPARWRRKKDQEATYELWQDRRAEQELERKFATDRARIAQSLEKLVELAMGPEDKVPEKTGDPVMDSALRPAQWRSVGPVMRMLGEMGSQAQAAAVNGQQTWHPFSSLSPQAQTAFMQSSPGQSRLSFLAPGGERRVETDDEALGRLRQTTFDVQLALDPSEPRWNIAVSILAKDRDGKNKGVMTAGWPLGPIGISQTEQEDEKVAHDPLDDKPLKGGIAEVLRRATDWRQFADFQEFVAEQTGLPVVSDFYHDKPAPSPETLTAAKSLGELLTLATKPVRYGWHSDKGALLFRNRAWFLDDANEVPATLEARLTAAREKYGYLRLPELAEAATLNNELLRRLGTTFSGIEQVQMYRRLLAWYDALNERQQQTANDPQGLPLKDCAIRTRAILYPRKGEGEVDPLLSMHPDPRAVRLSARQERQGAAMITHFDVFGPLGLSVEYKFAQELAPEKARTP